MSTCILHTLCWRCADRFDTWIIICMRTQNMHDCHSISLILIHCIHRTLCYYATYVSEYMLHTHCRRCADRIDTWINICVWTQNMCHIQCISPILIHCMHRSLHYCATYVSAGMLHTHCRRFADRVDTWINICVWTQNMRHIHSILPILIHCMHRSLH